jgi:hypothetical protein
MASDDHYESYSWIQKHIQISEDLYNIDKLGKYFLEQITLKKNLKVGNRKGLLLSKEYEMIYNSINETINVYRYRSRLYLTLQYYMDEAMFNKIDESEKFFFIGDECFELTKMYFGQDVWINNVDVQRFELPAEVNLQCEEALLIRCFFTDYEKILKRIEALLEEVEDGMHYKTQISKAIGKIRSKHGASLCLLEDIVKKEFET